MEKYDTIIIGAGPNGLTLANYLIGSGAKVLIVERRFEVGGNLITEDFGGARYNLHSLYMLLGSEMPPYQDFGLEQSGCLFVQPEAQATVHTSNTKTLTLYRQKELSLKSIERVSLKDSKKFQNLIDDLIAIKNEIILPWMYNPALDPQKYFQWLERSSRGRLANQLAEMSPKQILTEHYAIESEPLRILLLALGCIWTIKPQHEKSGLMFAFLLHGMLNASLIRGGSYLLASNLYKRFISGGGDILDGREASRIIVENSMAKGVVLNDGRKLESKSVVSTIDIPTTFGKLLDSSSLLDDGMSEIANAQTWDLWSLFQANWTLKTRPNFRSSSGESRANDSLIHVVGYETSEDLSKQISAVSDGRTFPAGLVSFPSVLDSSQAINPLTVAKFCAAAPYKLRNREWDETKELFAESCFDSWASLTENMDKNSAMNQYAYPPTYIEMKISNCKKGSMNGGADNKLHSSRTPVKNLYVCGAGVHPGSMVTLAAGYNAASVIADDLGLKKWWRPLYAL